MASREQPYTCPRNRAGYRLDNTTHVPRTGQSRVLKHYKDFETRLEGSQLMRKNKACEHANA